MDFNIDGKVDLAVTLNGANNVMVFPGTGTGTFNSPLTFSVGTGPTALVAADFNKDKKLDLAVVNNTAASVSILMNNSTVSAISFTAGSTISAGLGLTPTSIVAADFNADTKLDLAVGNATDKDVSVLLGRGTGTFGAPVNAVFGQNVYAVATADFDKDGKLGRNRQYLFFIDKRAPGEWPIDILKPERQPLILKKSWTRLKLIMQVWPERVSRVSQPSNHLAGGDPVACLDPY